MTPRNEESRIDESERDAIEYVYFKLMFKKAKTYRKTRMLSTADETCQVLIDLIKEKIPSLTTPTPSAPAVGGAIGTATEPKTEEIKEEVEEEQKVETPTSTTSEPRTFWKFAVKAAYLKATMLANCMEYAKGKRLMFEFAEPVLIRLLQKFTPEIFKAEENRDDGIPASLSEKVLPDHYYSFQHRRLYAKLRKMNYFVGEAERLYRQLLHDQLRYYDLYDFAKFEEENPVMS